MNIVVSGATGLIGTELVAFLGQTGHLIHRLSRAHTSAEDTDILWDPDEQRLDPAALEGADAVVCLSGSNIAKGRWIANGKGRIRRSRIQSVSLLSRTIATMDPPPATLVCASAIGYYGAQRGDEVLTEESESGTDFLAQLCLEWEAAAQPAAEKGVRVVHLRFGIILSTKGGALQRMLPPFKIGLGGVLGSGSQYVSWLTLDEAVSIIDFVIQTDEIGGPVNAMTPNPVTNRQFTKTLGRVLGRPTLIPLPAPGVSLIFGEMGQALLLGGARALPYKLDNAGYRFRRPDLDGALRHILGK